MMQIAYGDVELRAALHRKKFDRMKSQKNVLIVEELGLVHARSRIDVAVINGCIHGYELKSEKDTLRRLPSQLEIYRKALGRLTIVCASKHLTQIEQEVPDWCGIIEAIRGRRGGFHFTSHRRATPNPELDARLLAHLLWKSEAVMLLSRYGLLPHELRKPRQELYEMIAEMISPKDITSSIKEFMTHRSGWRDLPALPLYGG